MIQLWKFLHTHTSKLACSRKRETPKPKCLFIQNIQIPSCNFKSFLNLYIYATLLVTRLVTINYLQLILIAPITYSPFMYPKRDIFNGYYLQINSISKMTFYGYLEELQFANTKFTHTEKQAYFLI